MQRNLSVKKSLIYFLKNSKKGKTVIRLHDGDPAIYGAIREQIDNLEKEGIESIVVPGVTSFLASAAALGTQLTLPGITQNNDYYACRIKN